MNDMKKEPSAFSSYTYLNNNKININIRTYSLSFSDFSFSNVV